MNVRTLCLAILTFGESTGYDIRKKASEGAYRHFVEASFGSIYPALAKLEADGCVGRREESHPGRPARKVYSITEAGQAEFRQALAEPIQRDVFRSSFLMAAFCAQLMDDVVLEEAVNTQVTNLRADLEEIEVAAAESQSASAAWVERFARHTINASLEFIAENRDELLAHSRSSNETSHFVEAAE